MSEIEETIERIRKCMKHEDHREDWFRVLIAVTEVGDIIKYITHDPKLNPGARPHGTRADEVLAYGQGFVQLMAACDLRGIDVREAMEIGLNNWEEADWRRRESRKEKDIKGRIACRGVAKGIAYVVSEKNPIEDSEEGCILVAEFVTPGMLLHLETWKPAAIVTNQGGTTSHAAIIARERLKIPCIVGTGNATERIKHGEMVIVDAEKEGVVKSIRRKGR